MSSVIRRVKPSHSTDCAFDGRLSAGLTCGLGPVRLRLDCQRLAGERMASAPIRGRPRLSIDVFRGFQEGRPEEERWELIDGVAVMMAPPTLAHQIIAGNLQRLLNEALETHAPTLIACQRAGVNVGPSVEYYDPEPDVVVIDTEATESPGEGYAD